MNNKEKKSFLKNLNLESCEIFEKILNVDLESCNNIEQSDYVVITMLHNFNINDFFIFDHYLLTFLKKSNKKIILFHGSDVDNCTIPSEFEDNIILFTCSGFDENNSNVFGCPTFNLDYFSGNFVTDKKLSVGFCGLTSKENEPTYNEFRFDIIDNLKKYPYFNVIERTYWGDIHALTYEEKIVPKKSKQEFIKNIEDNLYTLCVRGGGNFSFRLGETFMMGRIPVLINSDCILPFRDQIPYEKNTIFVTRENSNNFQNIDQVIQQYHNSHTYEELLKIQKEYRQIWLDYFTVDNAFYKTLNFIRSIT
jgi:hypothetical protein